eukprot:8334930-Prorocentrum_lima.AAC.1
MCGEIAAEGLRGHGQGDSERRCTGAAGLHGHRGGGAASFEADRDAQQREEAVRHGELGRLPSGAVPE